jgi:hypothetical protein
MFETPRPVPQFLTSFYGAEMDYPDSKIRLQYPTDMPLLYFL